MPSNEVAPLEMTEQHLMEGMADPYFPWDPISFWVIVSSIFPSWSNSVEMLSIVMQQNIQMSW